MHELSIATSVVETLSEELATEAGKVVSVKLRVGAMSGVIAEALHFAWDIACSGTRLSGSALEIEDVEARIWCDSCNSEQMLPGKMQLCCPVCSGPATRVIAGYELEIISVEVTQNE